jgi:hypothetical protein
LLGKKRVQLSSTRTECELKDTHYLDNNVKIKSDYRYFAVEKNISFNHKDEVANESI